MPRKPRKVNHQHKPWLPPLAELTIKHQLNLVFFFFYPFPPLKQGLLYGGGVQETSTPKNSFEEYVGFFPCVFFFLWCKQWQTLLTRLWFQAMFLIFTPSGKWIQLDSCHIFRAAIYRPFWKLKVAYLFVLPKDGDLEATKIVFVHLKGWNPFRSNSGIGVFQDLFRKKHISPPPQKKSNNNWIWFFQLGEILVKFPGSTSFQEVKVVHPKTNPNKWRKMERYSPKI